MHHSHSLVLTGSADKLDEALNVLLCAGFDTRVKHGAIIAYGSRPDAAGPAVAHLSWRVEEVAELLGNGPLELVADHDDSYHGAPIGEVWTALLDAAA